MKLSDKLAKVGTTVTINMYDNGYVFEIDGRDKKDDWTSAKIICDSVEKIVELLKEASSMERD